jgi:hypothetical protein
MIISNGIFNQQFLYAQNNEKKILTDEVDLNFDGLKEKLSVEFLNEESGYYYSYKLKINDAIFSGDGDNIIGNFKIVDLDKADNILEIAFEEVGPSDDYRTEFLYFNGNEIISMGKITGIIGNETSSIRIDGTGLLKTKTRGEAIHTWFYPDMYIISKERKLEHIDMGLYLMDQRVTLKQNLPLKKFRESMEDLIVLNKGETATIVSTDDKQWCLIESANGIRGWAEMISYSNFGGTNKSVNDIFDGLNFSD